MPKYLTLFLLMSSILQSCGDDPLACSDENFCAINESGSAVCADGYEWLNPDAAEDYRCKEKTYLPILGDGANSIDAVNLTVVGSSADGLNVPRDLGFNPAVAGQLWVVNRGDESMVIYADTATSSQSSLKKRDIFDGGAHFLAQPAGIAFASNGNFSTIHETAEETQGSYPESFGSTPFDFMGPTMWSSNLNIFNAGHAGHIDMMHNTPLGMGIAWEADNIYWVFDGYHSSITRYDFKEDHGPGGTIHDDGIVSRYAQGKVKRAANVVSHMELDRENNRLYIADTGNNRVAVLHTDSGKRGADLSWAENYDCTEFRCSDYHFIDDAIIESFVNGPTHDMTQPSGLAIHEGNIFVSDYPTGRIFAFTPEGKLVDWLDTQRPNALGGMEFHTDGSLYVVDSAANEVLRIQPQ